MDRLRLFSTQAGYEDEEANLRYPTVSYIEGTKEVMFIPEEVKYKQKYLTTEALESGAISFNIWKSMGTDMITSISYSTDNGQTWTTTNNTDNKSEHLVINANVNQGDKVLWKGIATQTGYNDSDDYGDTVGSFFSSDCEFNAYGNVMSLLYGDSFYNDTNLDDTHGTFAFLFHDYDDEEETCEVVSAQNLILPATTLTYSCYCSMFQDCTSLITAPVLPATTLVSDCYRSMFSGCTSLITAPELPAAILVRGCYQMMFKGCTNLNYIKAMFTTTPSNVYTASWVSGVASTGTFIKNSAATWTRTDVDGIPTGWTVQTASE